MASSTSPSNPLTTAPAAIPLFDDDEVVLIEREVDAGAVATAETVVVIVIGTVVVIVIGATFVLLGDVEPDVRLKITCPASSGNGAWLPLVELMHVLLYGLPGLQQNRNSSWK